LRLPTYAIAAAVMSVGVWIAVSTSSFMRIFICATSILCGVLPAEIMLPPMSVVESDPAGGFVTQFPRHAFADRRADW
jgi:hypothetical protein